MPYTYRPTAPFAVLAFILAAMMLSPTPLFAQATTVPPADTEETNPEQKVPDKVDVVPLAEDDDIANRLTRIMQATGWFENPQARVDEGVVFLEGTVDTQDHLEWATRLAGNTQDVVAVVNQIAVRERPILELTPAWMELRSLGRETIHYSPLLAVAAIVLILAWIISGWSAMGSRAILKRRWKNALLRDVVARAVAIPVFLLGLYIALKVSGLTRLAVTVLGGTGLVGLVLGFAFRDIAENFLSSVLISMQHPFATGDLIEVSGYKGFVQSVNTRATVLTTLEGSRVQIPNATIYKNPILNITANPNIRQEFFVGIGYDDPISQAQSIALKVLQTNEAVLQEPEPLVLVESLGTSAINLQVLYWVNIRVHDGLKVKSAIIRLVKSALTSEGITIPDEARELVFPQGVPVRLLENTSSNGNGRDRSAAPLGKARPAQKPAASRTEEPAAHEAEGSLTSDDEKIIEQGDQGRKEEGEVNLLEEN